MLDGLRKYASSWFAQLLLGLLVLSFAAWGVNDVFNGFRSGDVAVVGSTPISVADFQRTYQTTVRNLSQQIGQQLTPELARQFGVQNDVLGQLVSRATLDNVAQRMNLGVSNQQLTKVISSNPQFAGVTGTFDRRLMQQMISQNGYSEDDYILGQRKELIRGQLAQAFAGGVVSPVTYLQAVHDYQSEERDISYIPLSAKPASSIADPSETVLIPYFNDHKDEWKAPELRALNYFTLTTDDVTDVAAVSDEDAQKAYDTQSARWSNPEKRRIQQIVFKDKAEADAAAAAIAAGKTFDDLLAERNMKPADADLGTFTKDKVVDPKIADAAFALALNVPSAVVEGQFGPAIVRVTEIDAATVTTFDAAKDEIKKEIAAQRAATEVNARHDAIEDARAGGDPLATIAAKYGLKVVTVPSVDESGKDANDTAVPNLPTGLVVAAFSTGVGDENDPIRAENGSYVWYEVSATTAPRDRTLDEVRVKVVAAWKDAERGKELDALATQVKQRLDNKEDIQTVATDVGSTVKTATKVTRTTKPTDDVSAAAVASVFDGPKGSVTVADGAQPMTRVVLRVDNISVPPFDPASPALSDSKQALDGQFITALLTLYVGHVQGQTKITFNQAALQTVIGSNDDTAQ
jgi:peptidyl-prolyl cis-trans isomerase D